jgi:leucyl-tRNA synthetase
LVPLGINQDQAVALAKAHEKVAPFLAGKSIVKVVFVPNRILNLVVS